MALVGIGLFAYPVVSNYLFAMNASTATEDYSDIVDQTNEEELERLWQEAVTYNESLEGNPVRDPFLAGSGMVLAENYASLLRLEGTDSMGFISIPTIGVRLPIYHGTADSILQRGIGHLEGSSLPIGGLGSHSVITGHTGLVHAKLFTDLHRMSEGDLFFVHVLDRSIAYEVDQIKVVEPDDVSDLRRTPGEDYCTMVTCTPYGINSHRLLLRGRRVDYSPEMEGELIAASRGNMWQWFSEWNMIIGLAAGLSITVVIIIMYVITRRKLAKRRKYWWYEENGLS